MDRAGFLLDGKTHLFFTFQNIMPSRLNRNVKIQEELRQKTKELLAAKTVDVVIGYGPTETGGVGPVFYTDPNDCDQFLFNERCTANLVVYLKRKEIKKLGKPAIIVKGCDAKALAVLEIEKQIDRENLYVIGVVCDGVWNDPNSRTQTDAAKCAVCDVQNPLHCDVVLGTPEEKNETKSVEERYAKLDKILAMNTEERLAYWKKEFERCFKCYACRQVCPMCYCEVCVADKNRPVRFDTSATEKGNFAWHIVRAFHLSGRCVGCSNCASACPAGIDLDLLNLTLAKAAETQFGFRAGFKRDALPLIGTFSPDDQEEFIR